jgi:putative DNA methylase
MRDEAEKRIGHLYPKVEITEEMAKERPDLKPLVGRKLTVIAWLWARTVKSPNPAFANVDVPLASTFMLSTKPGKEAYVEPVIDLGGAGVPPAYRFTVKVGKPKDAEAAKAGTKLARGANFRCVMSGAPISGDYIKAEGKAGRMGERLMAIVAEGERGRVYLSPTAEHDAIARSAQPTWKPDTPSRGTWASNAQGRRYGFRTFGDLFTPRQLVALTTFSDLVQEARERVKRDALAALGTRASGPHEDEDAGGTPAHPAAHLGWHSRGYHPHFDVPGLLQSITFRLHDSVPGALLDQWRAELGVVEKMPADSREAQELRRRIEEYEDAGYGACHLRDPRLAALVQEALLHFDGRRYKIIDRCVMPNHVHVLIETVPGHALGDVVQSWKSYTAKEANKILGSSGTFWMADYFDRYIRNETHLAAVRSYIRENPVRARLCATAAEWRFGSAWEGREEEEEEEEERAGGPRTGPRTNTRTEDDDLPLRDGVTGPTAYAEAVGVYLSVGVDRLCDRSSTICSWDSGFTKIRNTFGRQAIPMTWDYAEGNPFSDSTGNFSALLEWVQEFLNEAPAAPFGDAAQQDASSQTAGNDKLVSTDPPYYDNIGYADLSDFFYVWLRRALRNVFPDLFATLAVPKAEELVATPYRHGSKDKAESFFLEGMTQAMRRLAEQSHPAFPVTIYYAFKQSETLGARASGPQEDEDAGGPPAHPGIARTGWETFLDAVIEAGFGVSGTWPMRTELANRMIGSGTNALASSIVLVCRPRPAGAPTTTRREFVAALKAELPAAIRLLQGLGPSLGRHASGAHAGGTPALPGIAPVDLAQAAIGPGMAIYTRFARVLDAEGRPLTVRDALALINQTLDEVLAQQEGDFDADAAGRSPGSSKLVLPRASTA